jgi:hypothetical protein
MTVLWWLFKTLLLGIAEDAMVVAGVRWRDNRGRARRRA